MVVLYGCDNSDHNPSAFIADKRPSIVDSLLTQIFQSTDELTFPVAITMDSPQFTRVMKIGAENVDSLLPHGRKVYGKGRVTAVSHFFTQEKYRAVLYRFESEDGSTELIAVQYPDMSAPTELPLAGKSKGYGYSRMSSSKKILKIEASASDSIRIYLLEMEIMDGGFVGRGMDEETFALRDSVKADKRIQQLLSGK